MNMELHSTGASFIAEKTDHNPRDLVIEVVKAMPSAGRTERFERFRASLSEMGDEYHRAVEWYFFVNMHDYLTTSRNRTDQIQRSEARVKHVDMVESIKAQIVLLDLTMTNGKLLGDCTGAELATLGNRFQKLADRVGKAKTVRSVLSEDQVKAIMK